MLALVNIRSMTRPTCSREPTEHQWEQLEDELAPITRAMPADVRLETVQAAVPLAEVLVRWRARFDLEPE